MYKAIQTVKYFDGKLLFIILVRNQFPHFKCVKPNLDFYKFNSKVDEEKTRVFFFKETEKVFLNLFSLS